MSDFIEVNTRVFPEQILPYQVTVKLKTENKSFEARLLNLSECISFYYFRKGPMNRLFSKSKYAFHLITPIQIANVGRTNVFDYSQLIRGRSFEFDDADKARIFSSEIMKYLNDYIQNKYCDFNKLVQESDLTNSQNKSKESLIKY